MVKKGEKCPTCGRYYSREIVNDCVIVRDGKILLGLRNENPQKDFWALIGGYLDWDETVEQSAYREIKEELGVDSKIIKMQGVYSDPKRDLDEKENVSIVYVVELLGEPFVKDSKELKEIKWFEPNDLPENIAFDHREIIEDYLKTEK